jgi:mutator protein MutT
MAERFTTRIAVYVIVRNDEGEILLQQRANTGYLDGYWDFPSGHAEYGEPLREAAARETAEEVGVTARTEDLRLIHIDQFFMDKNYINFIFSADKWRGQPKICEPDKCSAVGFFAPDALPEKCVNAVRAAERTSFSDQLTYSVTDQSVFHKMIV